LVQQGEQAEKIIAKIKAEENKPRPEKSTRRTSEVSFQSKREDTLATETKSPVKPPRPEGVVLQVSRASTGSTPSKTCMLIRCSDYYKSNRLKLPEARHPEKVGKNNNLNYCLYHRILGHPTKSCYIFKDILQALIDVEVLKVRPEQEKVTANMTSFFSSGYSLQ